MTPKEYAEDIMRRCWWKKEQGPHPGFDGLDVEIEGAVCKAVAEAVAAEREACAAILDASADRQKAAWDRLQADNHPGPYTSHESIYRHFADAIRARKG